MRLVLIAFLLFLVAGASHAAEDAAKQQARATATLKQMWTIVTAIEAYLTDASTPPAVADIESLAKVLEPTYIRDLPRADAWGTAFRYESDARGYRVVSAGSDRAWVPTGRFMKKHGRRAARSIPMMKTR